MTFFFKKKKKKKLLIIHDSLGRTTTLLHIEELD
jgi:hypothetical protein